MVPGTSSSPASRDAAAACRGGARAFLPGLSPAGLDVRAACAQIQAWLPFLLALVLLLAAARAHAATPPNAPITNTVTVSYDIGSTTLTTSGAATVRTAGATPATIQFLAYAPGVSAGVGGTATYNVAGTACRAAGGGFTQLPAPAVPGSGTLPSPGSYPLGVASAYAASDVAFLQVTDYSANVDPSQAEPILVTVTTPAGDAEQLRLVETGPSTGVFVGYVPLRKGAVVPGDCRLEVGANERLVATYVQSGTSAVSTSTALVDPLGLVFDAATGLPVDGARVTLVDVATGQPATVFGNDGVSAYPSTVVTGSTVTDSGGATYVLGPGRYQFPRVNAPGSYRLQVEPPLGYRFPSVATDAALQQLPTAPFQLSVVSRGGAFTVLPGPPVESDVPLDPGPLGTVDITKTAGKAVVGLGDFVPYTVTVSTSSAQALPGVQVLDRLPPGFRYLAGSARLNGAVFAEPQVGADGRSVLFSLGTLPAKSSVSLTYATSVGASATSGPAQNTAQAVGRIASNVAAALVTVREDLNRSRAILAGQVTVAPTCEADANDRASRVPLAGVRVLLQDGTYVLTDQEGNWHIDNVRAGTHVVQLDTTTLPAGVRLQSCEDHDRLAGRAYSQFVNVRGGTLWRADFRYAPAPACLRQSLRRSADTVQVDLEGPVGHGGVAATVLLPAGASVDPASVRVDGKTEGPAQLGDGFLVLRSPAAGGAWARNLSFRLLGAGAQGDVKLSVRTRGIDGAESSLAPLALAAGAAQADGCAALPPPDFARARKAAAKPAHEPAAGASAAPGVQLVEQLPYDDQWLAAAKPGYEWLHPQADFQPSLPLVKVAVKHAVNEQVELVVNGQPVNPLRFEGSIANTGGTVALSNWRAVDLHEGSNTLDVVLRGPDGAEIRRERRAIHYVVAIGNAALEPARSRLVADGRTPPVVAVRFTDAAGKPVRRGSVGEFSIEPPFVPQQLAQAIQREPLTGQAGGRAKFEIGEDGVALIPLQPTSQSGEAVLRFDLGGNRSSEVRAWLQADAREWVLVGFAEGTVGHKTLSGNMQALRDATAGEQLFDQNRLAFYAKGTVKGEYLLTAAYDTAKARDPGATPLLRQTIDPNAYYTLFGDATQQQYDASSLRKLYLKLEKKQFYLLFGDFNTGLTVTELGRYSRTVNGVKVESKGETLSYNAFATRSTQASLRDEVQGDGTSGLYRLRGRNIVPNTDKVRIEVRDRFQPERVLATRPLATWLDYQIDYASGTLLLREPLAARDDAFNPQLLVAEYETDNGGNEAWTYGGRAAVAVTPDLVVGATRVHEGDVGRAGTLSAADATLKIDATTKARVEVARSEREADTGAAAGRAYLAEAVHDDGRSVARAYVREQQAGFGLGQQSAIASGQRRIGAEGRSKLTDTVQVQGEVSRGEDLATGASRELAEGRVQWQAAEHLKLQAGARAVEEDNGQGASAATRQVMAGANYEALEQRLVLRASTEIGSSSGVGGVATYPNRVLVGADYRVAPGVTVVAQHEVAQAGGVRTATSSVGLRTEPWKGAELKGSVGQQASTDAERLYASLGLVQRWKVSDAWSVDAGLEQSHTLNGTVAQNPLGAAQIPASGVVPASSPFAALPSGTVPASGLGLVASDYTSIFTGVAYKAAAWSGNARIEWRGSDIDTKLNVLAGVQRRLDEGRTLAAGLQVTRQRAADLETDRLNARLSYAWRPSGSDWMVLDRLDYVDEATPSLAARLFTRKLINNLNANWKPVRRVQVAFQYSAKLVRETLQDVEAHGFTDLAGVEARYDLTPDIDIGMHAGVLRTMASGQRADHLGLSIGYRLATNTWVSVGYNVAGFRDADFAGAEYRAKGFYLNLRTKFDQDTLGLNERKTNAIPLQP